MNKTLMLIILDGFGINKSKNGNAIKSAHTPTLDNLFNTCPNSLVGASGMDVGLPDGQMGNSEVGHTNIGAGRIVYQELTRITKSIADGDFFKNKELLGAIENCKKYNSALHIMGLNSNGGVHSHINHLYGLLELAKRNNLSKVYIHAFMDGRDTAPSSGELFIKQVSDKTKEIGIGKIATVIGRYYAMDRDNRWDRVNLAYDALVLGKGEATTDPHQAVLNSYENNTTDEFIKPIIVEDTQRIQANDSVIFYNFRPDRARELTKSLVNEDFNEFDREKGYFPLYFVCMTEYEKSIKNVHIAFKPQKLVNTLGEYISKKGLTQLRIAETEKYAHVTFFFNGGCEAPYENEDRVLIPSPKVATYDMKPEMSAYELTDEVISKVESGKYDVIILNYANCDMVGHTGDMQATIKAVETVDDCLGKLMKKVHETNSVALIMADHGNADKMVDKDGSPFTAHTTNPVPLIVVGKDVELKDGGKLCDIAPTMLDILKMQKPKEMTGISLIL